MESGQISAHTRSKSDAEQLGDAAVEARDVTSEDPVDDDLRDAPRHQSASSDTPGSLGSAGTASPSITPSLSTSPQPTLREGYSLEPPVPPVTKITLSELDVNKIIHNPKLRHDINFDPELHFRPNLDGERGRRKQEKANQFWRTLSDQLMLFVTDREEFQRRYRDGGDWCLPQLLRAVREIIQTLVPLRDREFLNEGLNVDLLMQQFNKGIADLERLASWLSGILKLHCAPMRDEWIDEMYYELSTGNRNNDMDLLVKGMRTLLSVLEAMKLDVANHQIRCLRPVLIEDTVNFEQRFFVKRLSGGRLNLDSARSWYQSAKAEAPRELSNPRHPYAMAFGETTTFFWAVSRLVLPSTPVEVPNSNACPNTFVFDEERIVKLRSDMHDTIGLEVCMRQFEALEEMSNLKLDLDLDMNFHAPHFSRPSSFVGSDGGSTNSSPRNSGYLGVHSTVDTADIATRSRDLYNSLVALLRTAPPATRASQRWQGLSPSMALQIMRFVKSPQIRLSDLEDELSRKLSQITDDPFQEVEGYFHRNLVKELARRVKDLKNLSGVGLFEVATGGRLQGLARSTGESRLREQLREQATYTSVSATVREARDEGGIEDMATRLAHLGLLHWRVWAELAYSDGVEVDMDNCAP